MKRIIMILWVMSILASCGPSNHEGEVLSRSYVPYQVHREWKSTESPNGKILTPYIRVVKQHYMLEIREYHRGYPYRVRLKVSERIYWDNPKGKYFMSQRYSKSEIEVLYKEMEK